jgi:hypothetical protein
MKIFISWSGQIAQQIAGELHPWLRLVLQGIEPFITSSDIEKGAKWQGEIVKELSECNYGIVVLTPQNQTSQWLAFEAGALSKQLDGRVATLLFNLQPGAIVAPLSMFQATRFEEADVRQLVGDINSALPAPLQRPAQELDTMFDKFWPDLWGPIDLILQGADATPMPAAPSKIESMAQEMLTLLRQQTAILSNPQAFISQGLVATSEDEESARSSFRRLTIDGQRRSIGSKTLRALLEEHERLTAASKNDEDRDPRD